MNQAQVVHRLLFGNAQIIAGEPVVSYERGTVKGVKIDGVTYLTQNPAKRSKWGNIARRGVQITWVIINNRYVGRVINGQYQRL